MFCKKCGAELKEGAKFCAKCGAPTSAAGGAVQEVREGTSAAGKIVPEAQAEISGAQTAASVQEASVPAGQAVSGPREKLQRGAFGPVHVDRKPSSRKKLMIGAGAGILCLIVLISVVCCLNSDSYLYRKASEAFEKENYRKAEKIFSRITDYKDSEEKYGAAGYFYAMECAEQSDYEKALELLREHEQYAVTVDAEDIKALKNRLAEGLRGQEKYEEAAGLYQEIGDTWAAAECYAETENYLQALELTQDISLQSEQAAARRGWHRAQSILYAKEKKYDEALEFMKDDSAEYEDEWGQAVYETAEFLADEERYEDAFLLLEKIKNDKEEAGTLLTKYYESYAINYAQSGDYENAVKYYDLSGKKETVRPYLYDMAKACMNEGSEESYDRAISIWENVLKDYQDSEAQLMECYRQLGLQYEQKQAFSLALGCYEKCGDEALIQECRYNWANQQMDIDNNLNLEEAIELFTELGDYKDSAEKILECNYRLACYYKDNEDYEQADELFRKIYSYKDSADQLFEMQKALYEEVGSRREIEGVWKTNSGDITIEVYIPQKAGDRGDLRFIMPLSYFKQNDTSIDYRLKCGLDETFGPGSGGGLGGSTTKYNNFVWDNWNYSDGILTLGQNSYQCTLAGDSIMYLTIEERTFTLFWTDWTRQ